MLFTTVITDWTCELCRRPCDDSEMDAAGGICQDCQEYLTDAAFKGQEAEEPGCV